MVQLVFFFLIFFLKRYSWIPTVFSDFLKFRITGFLLSYETVSVLFLSPSFCWFSLAFSIWLYRFVSSFIYFSFFLIEITNFWPTKMIPDLFSDFLFSFQFPPQNPGPFHIDHFVLPLLLLKITWTQVRSHWTSHTISHRYVRILRLIRMSLKLKKQREKKIFLHLFLCSCIPYVFLFSKTSLSVFFIFFFIQASLVLFEQSRNFQRKERSHVMERWFFSTTENTVKPLMWSYSEMNFSKTFRSRLGIFLGIQYRRMLIKSVWNLTQNFFSSIVFL